MRNKIFGAIGILWGGGLVFRWLFGGSTASANDAYQSGQNAAVMFGLLMLCAGLYYFFKKPK